MHYVHRNTDHELRSAHAEALATAIIVRLSRPRESYREAEERLSRVSHDGVDALSYSDLQASMPSQIDLNRK